MLFSFLFFYFLNAGQEHQFALKFACREWADPVKWISMFCNSIYKLPFLCEYLRILLMFIFCKIAKWILSQKIQ